MTDEIRMTSDKDLLEWRENVSGWVGKHNKKFYGGKKEAPDQWMIYDCATHNACPKCFQETIPKHWSWCDNCKEAGYKERWASLPAIDYSEVEGILYSESHDRYFQDKEDAEDYCECEEITLEDLRLVATVRMKLHEIGVDVISEQIDLDDGTDPFYYVPDSVKEALDNLNQAILDSVLDLWEPVNKRVRF